MAPLRQLQLLWHTTRHLRASQIAARLRLRGLAAGRRLAPGAARRRYARVARRLPLLSPGRLWGRPDPSRLRALVSPEARLRAEQTSANARVRRFTFLNETADLGRPLDWNPDRSRLWRYQLHYFGGLPDWMGVAPSDWPEAAALMSEWIETCPLERVADAWHPFVVSERIVNWLFAIELGAPSPDAVSAAVWQSLAIQAVFVSRNLETDVGGNHYLKNLKALAIASCVFSGPGADRWRARFPAAFAEELSRQLLADGAHYERSPMYHGLVLADAIEVAYALTRGGHPVPGELAACIRRMAAYLPQITHPDGEIALFNDSVFGEAPPPAELRNAAAAAAGDPAAGPMSMRHAMLAADAGAPSVAGAPAPSPAATEDGGIERLTVLGGRGVLLVDVGRACPDDLPAHAHADFFSFELSLDARRVIVDAGVGAYAAGPWREYYRSTRAHNTVAVDGLDQIECWGSFRVARRASVLNRRTFDGPLARGVQAWHDGYRRLGHSVHAGRTVVALDDRAWLVIDRLHGDGVHTWESFLHGHPDLTLSIEDDTHASFQAEGLRLSVAWFGVSGARSAHGDDAPLQGWHAPEFGRHLPSPTLVMAGAGPMPAWFGYVLAPDEKASDLSIEQNGLALSVRVGEASYSVNATTGSVVTIRTVDA